MSTEYLSLFCFSYQAISHLNFVSKIHVWKAHNFLDLKYSLTFTKCAIILEIQRYTLSSLIHV